MALDSRPRDTTRLRPALVLFAVVVVAIVLGLIWAGYQTAPAPTPEASDSTSDLDGPAGTAPGLEGSADAVRERQLESALATRPMLDFPDQAALPQTLATRPSAPRMVLPAGSRAGRWVPEGFPGTPEGAAAQLAALLEVGLRDVNPTDFAAAYRSVSLPGAPDPASTPLGRDIASLYGQAVTAASDPAPLSSRWQPAGALIKGQADSGRFVVACVLGELQVVKTGSASAGTGDCQAMRWTGRDWRISPGPAAARPPIVWPGSDAFIQAGYRPTTGDS